MIWQMMVATLHSNEQLRTEREWMETQTKADENPLYYRRLLMMMIHATNILLESEYQATGLQPRHRYDLLI